MTSFDLHYYGYLQYIGLNPPFEFYPLIRTNIKYPCLDYEYDILRRRLKVWDLDHESTHLFRQAILEKNLETINLLVNKVSNEELLIVLGLLVFYEWMDPKEYSNEIVNILLSNIRDINYKYLNYVLEKITSSHLKLFVEILPFKLPNYSQEISVLYTRTLMYNPDFLRIFPEDKVFIYAEDLHYAYNISKHYENPLTEDKKFTELSQLLLLSNNNEFNKFLEFNNPDNAQEKTIKLFRDFVKINSFDKLMKLKNIYNENPLIQDLLKEKQDEYMSLVNGFSMLPTLPTELADTIYNIAYNPFMSVVTDRYYR